MVCFYLCCDLLAGIYGYLFEDVGDAYEWEKSEKTENGPERVKCAPYVRLGSAMGAALNPRSNPVYVALRCIWSDYQPNSNQALPIFG